MVFMIESHVAYIMDALKLIDRTGASTVEVKQGVADGFNRDLQDRLKGTVWNIGGCSSWYLDAKGRNKVKSSVKLSLPGILPEDLNNLRSMEFQNRRGPKRRSDNQREEVEVAV